MSQLLDRDVFEATEPAWCSVADHFDSVTMLPGRIAVLVKKNEQGLILKPDRTREYEEVSRAPGRALLRGWIVGRSERMGRARIPAPKVGTPVLVEPADGLIIEHLDTDISLGSIVPEGYTLRMYGVSKQIWFNSVPIAL